uniref:plasmid partitioning/stability family protein n=1 Tax=Enterobacter sp. TaxID=42895 RepID=UPI00296EA9DC|nr:plasmid partitioning/stability family protein [Enterobacter sp.]
MMEKPDTRRKITFYLNPESSPAERYVCDEIDRMPQGERGRVWRAAMLAGFALRKQDVRLPQLLAELLTQDTTFDEMILVMQAVFPEEMKNFGNRRPLPAPEVTPVKDSDNTVQQPVNDEARTNALAMFGNQRSPDKGRT